MNKFCFFLMSSFILCSSYYNHWSYKVISNINLSLNQVVKDDKQSLKINESVNYLFNNKPYIKKSTNNIYKSSYSPIKKHMRTIDNYNINEYQSIGILDFNTIKELLYATSNGFHQFTVNNLNIFHNKHSFNTKECNILIKELGDRGYINQIQIIYDFMILNDIKPTIITYSTLISRAGKWKNVNSAEKYYFLMIKNNIIPDLICYNSLINSYSKSGKYDKALLLYNNMINNNIKPNTDTFNTLIDLYSRNLQPNKAQQIMLDMNRFNVVPNCRSYTSLIHAWCQINNINEAKKIFIEMELKSIYPTLITFSILLHALGKAGELDEAFQLLRSMKSKGIRPNVVILSSLLHACSKHGNLDFAFDIYNEMSKSNDLSNRPNSITCSALIDSCLKNSQVDKAVSVLQDMKQRGMKLTEVTYTSIITELTRLNMIDRILEFTGNNDYNYLSNEILHNNINSSSIYFPMSAKSLNNNNIHTNFRLLFNNINKNLNRYSIIMYEIDNILSIVLDHIHKSTIPMDYYFNITLLRDEAILIQQQIPKIQQIIDIQKNLIYDSQFDITNSSDIIITCQNIINNKNKLDTLISIRDELNLNRLNKNETINILKDIFIKNGEYNVIVEEYERMKSTGITLDIKTYSTLMTSIYKKSVNNVNIESSINNSRQTKAEQMKRDDLFRLYLVFQEMKYNPTIQLDTAVYNTLINACAGVGDIDRALETMTAMQENGIEPNVITYTSLIKACAFNSRNEMIDLAENIFNEMQQRSNHFSNYIQPNEMTYEKLMQVYSYHGYTPHIISRMYTILDEILQRNIKPTLKTYRFCIRASIFDDDIDKSLYILDLIRSDSSIKFDLITWSLVLKLCERLNVDDKVNELSIEINSKSEAIFDLNE